MSRLFRKHRRGVKQETMKAEGQVLIKEGEGCRHLGEDGDEGG